MKSIAVYCGSSSGNKSVYAEGAKSLGQHLAKANIELIFGAGCVGLMGIVADAVLENGGKATGVIPTFLVKWEVAHQGLTEMIEVETMHERKQIMCDRADAVIVMPGGFGTLDEFFEMLTWAQLGLHQKPIGVLNINGYFDHLFAQLNHMVQEGFLKSQNKDLVIVSNDVSTLLEKLANPPQLPEAKWLAGVKS